jgi:uncharacterized protein (TIRG00374 family)
MNKAIKKTAAGLLRLGIGLGIIFYLLFKINLKNMLGILHQGLFHWPWLVMGLLIFLICCWIGIARWKIILDVQGLRMAWSRVFCVFFIGQFFNSFMFGSTGGDLARGYYAAKETHHKKTEAVATVVIDRLIGLVVLHFIATIMLIICFRFYLQNWSTHVPALIMLGMITATIVLLLVIFNLRFFAGWPIFRFIEHNHTLRPIIRRLIVSIYLYRRRQSTIWKTALLSLLSHTLLITQCYCIGRCLQVEIGISDYFMIIPLIMSISALPITPGGLGIREGLAVTLFGALDVSASQALPLSLLIYFISVVFSLVGGLIFLGYTAGAGRTVHDEIVEFEDETARENR